MKKFLFFFSVMALTSSAFAADDVEIKPHAEVRTRYWNMMSPYGATDTSTNADGSVSYVEQRNMLGFSLRKGEKLGGQITLINNLRWGNDIRSGLGNTNARGGATSSSTPYADDGIGTNENMFLVNEAYMWWKFNDSMSLYGGRGLMTQADGSFYARNDWQPVPYATDTVAFMWDMESVKTNFFATKVATLKTPGAVEANDPQSNSYGANISLKNLPDALSMAHLYLLEIIKDQDGPTTTQIVPAMGFNVQHANIALAGASNHIDYHLDGGMDMGTLTNNNAGASGKTINVSTSMIDANVGYSLPDTMKFHVYANYHQDSGDADETSTFAAGTAPAGTDNKWGRYIGLWYDAHKFGGLMDIVRWGNLTYLQGGFSLTPMENTDVGFKWTQFSRTSNKDGLVPGLYGSQMLGNGSGAGPASGSFSPGNTDSSDIGSEFDLTVDHSFDAGFSGELMVAQFTPGDYLKNGHSYTNNAGGGAGSSINKTITEIMIQGKMTF